MGFTLIEIIAVLLLTSVAGGILYFYFNSAFVESLKPLSDVQKFYDLHKVMENMIADYSINHPEWQRRQQRWQKLTYYPVSAMIRAAGNKGYVYRCSVAGKSGTSEHSGFAMGAAFVDEGVGLAKWEKRNGLNDLKNKIALIPSEYGTYIVQENKFIKFVSVSTDVYQDQEILPTEPETILKVTISNDSGTALTNLFTNVN
jgi:hypothetical protein